MKTTNTGQYLHKLVHAPQNYKHAAIRSLVYRAYRLSSTADDFENSFITIRNIFINLGYHYKIIEKIKNAVISKINSSPQNTPTDEKPKILYFSLPYVSKFEKLNRKLINSINNIIRPHASARLVHTTRKSQSFFPNKDRVPAELSANIVYKFSCEHNCDRVYIGETSRHFKTRTNEHITGSPNPTEISTHQHLATTQDFKILIKTKYPLIAEALYYYAEPVEKRLNKYKPPFELKLFNFQDEQSNNPEEHTI